MIRQTAAAVVVFLIALVVGMMIAGTNGDASAAPTTVPIATTTTTEPRAFFVAPEETVVGPVVIVAEPPSLDGNQLTIDFSITSLAPTADAADVTQQLGFGNTLVVPPEELNTVFLDNWVISAGESVIAGGPANPAARAARFDVGEGFDLNSLDSITIDSFAVLTPINVDLELAVGSESARVAPGVTARLLAVTEQARTIVQVELLSERGFNLDNLRVAGAGPGWVSAVREAEGRPRWNLTYDGTVAPSPIPIRVEGTVWVAVDGGTQVATGDES
ncbi:MAG: hypothetical protein QNJ81_11055 [Acidimicrobiia bacterium]|nr:hypothetical protein [Acidimicrobiia bacterium]